jgi:hypothetical protein
MMSAWNIFIEIIPVLAMALAVALIPLCNDRP